MTLSILGNTVRQPVRQLETFAAPPHCQTVTLMSGELTSICPVTGQPDFSTVTITYAPNALCLESKSLKLYLWAFRDEGHFCEALADRIASDVYGALAPRWVRVIVNQAVRGGIAIEALSEYSQENERV